MVKLIVGVKGTGKTKTLIELVHKALDSSNGSVVCIEKKDKLRFDIDHRCRLIEACEYLVDDAVALFGFVAGITAADHDITDLFIDGTLKMMDNNLDELEGFVKKVKELTDKLGINCVMTVSAAVDKLPASLMPYVM